MNYTREEQALKQREWFNAYFNRQVERLDDPTPRTLAVERNSSDARYPGLYVRMVAA